MAAFADSADMVARYDPRTLGDICSDNGQRADTTELSTNTKMTAALDTATGEIKAAVKRGERYTTAELEALTGDGLAYLVDLTCQIAFVLLYRRKPYVDDKVRDQAREESDAVLEQLRRGDIVFDIERTQDAGTPKIETVTRIEINDEWGLFVDQARGRLYPRRRTYRNR